VLAGFSQSKLEALSLLLECETVPAGAVIRPEKGDGVFRIVLSGKVCIGVSQSDVEKWLTGGRAGHVGGRKPPLRALHEMRTHDLATLDDSALHLEQPFILSSGDWFGPLPMVQVCVREHVTQFPLAWSRGLHVFARLLCPQSRFDNTPAIAIDSTQVLELSIEHMHALSEKFGDVDVFDNAAFFRTMPLFASWSHSRLVRLATHVTLKVFPPGELIVRQVWLLPGLESACFVGFSLASTIPRTAHCCSRTHSCMQYAVNAFFAVSFGLRSAVVFLSAAHKLRGRSTVCYVFDALVLVQGDAPEHMFFLKRGVCKVQMDSVSDHKTRWPSGPGGQYESREWSTTTTSALGALLTGEYFGEASILAGTVRTRDWISSSSHALI
jgi:hypothetical protein